MIQPVSFKVFHTHDLDKWKANHSTGKEKSIYTCVKGILHLQAFFSKIMQIDWLTKNAKLLQALKFYLKQYEGETKL